MKLLVAALACLLLAQVARAGIFGGWGWGLDGYRDARSNYYEMITNCEQEGGECIDVDFNTGVIGVSRSKSGGGENEGAQSRGNSQRRPPGRMGRRPPAAARRRTARPQPVNTQEILNYLYNECRSWEFDFGCHRKGNICCY